MSFDDLNGGADNIMYMGKYDPNAPKFEAYSAFKLWNFGFKTSPKDGVNIAHSKTTQHKFKWANGDYATEEKSATKLGMKKSDVQFDIAAANDKWSVKAATPLVKDDWNVDGSVNVEHKPTKEYKGEVAFGVESPDLGGAKLNMNFSAEYKNALNAEKKEWEQSKLMKLDACANIDGDWHVGACMEHDTAALGGVQAGISKNDDGNCYWMIYDAASDDEVSHKHVKVGCKVTQKSFTHAYEAKYFMDGEKHKRLNDWPLQVVFSGNYKLSKATSFGYSVEAREYMHGQCKFNHAVDKNWKVAAHQSYDMSKKAEKPYNLGFDVTYTL